MTKVVVKNGNVDGALRMFKQKNIKNGLLKEVREREHYSKPGVKKRLAKKYGECRQELKNGGRPKGQFSPYTISTKPKLRMKSNGRASKLVAKTNYGFYL